jgi:hypothetical protein
MQTTTSNAAGILSVRKAARLPPERISGQLSRGIFLSSQSEPLLTFTSTHVVLGSLNSPSRQNGAALLEIEKNPILYDKGRRDFNDTNKNKKTPFYLVR